MDRDHGRSSLSEQQVTPPVECRTCTIAQQAARHAAGKDADEDVVVLDEPGLPGLVVVPCQHVGGLDELSDRGRARVLAALRRATRSVLESNPGSETAIAVMTGPPASKGHACFQVLPRAAEDRGGLPPTPE